MNKAKSIITDFIEWHLKITSNEKRYVFRGHSDSTYPLIPKIARKKTYHKICKKTVPVDKRILEKREELLNTSLSVRLPAYGYDFTHLNPDQALWKKYIIAQHYEAPTRLLDFTRNPLVALYFCVENDNNGPDGEVIAVQYSNHEPLNNAFVLEDVHNCPPQQIESSFFIRPPQIDIRIQFQQSVFCCIHEPWIPLNEEERPFGIENKKDIFLYYSIKNKFKKKIKKELNLIGINHSIIFPDLYGYAKYISWKINGIT